MLPSITIDLANLALTPQTRSTIAGSLETKLIIVRPDINLGKIPKEGMNFSLQVAYNADTDLPPSIVKLPIGMRERRNRSFSPTPDAGKPPTGITTVTIMVHIENYARSGELVVVTGPSGPGDWMEKTSSGWIEVMP